MNGGWIKLHRQVLNNEIFRHDPTAWRVFEVLLLLADKSTAEWSGGLYQLTGFTGIKKDALYKAVKRLENAKMVTRRVNSKYTVYRICKWGDYQGSETGSVNAEYTESKNKVKTEYNSNKNKEIRIKNNSNVEIQSIYDHYIETFKKNKNQYRLTASRKSKIQARLEDAGKDMLLLAIDNTADSDFHMGDNDRGWRADLDFIIRSYEQTEKLANMAEQKAKDKVDLTKLEIDWSKVR